MGVSSSADNNSGSNQLIVLCNHVTVPHTSCLPRREDLSGMLAQKSMAKEYKQSCQHFEKLEEQESRNNILSGTSENTSALLKRALTYQRQQLLVHQRLMRRPAAAPLPSELHQHRTPPTYNLL